MDDAGDVAEINKSDLAATSLKDDTTSTSELSMDSIVDFDLFSLDVINLISSNLINFTRF